MISSLKWWCNELSKNVCLGSGAFEGHDEVWSKTDVLASGGCRIGSHGDNICMVLEFKRFWWLQLSSYGFGCANPLLGDL